MLIKRDVIERKAPLYVDAGKCTACKACLKLGCPAIEWNPQAGPKGQAQVNRLLCVGCGVCEQVCKFGAFGVCNGE
jgi:indolepyruvate ferredoxin oxidoreductase alpha subunit